MSHPRLVTILSTTLASMVAFYVATRWRLIGTLGGAALIPLVHALVSHWSNRGIDRSIALIRRQPPKSSAPTESTPGSPGGSEALAGSRSSAPWLPWLLLGSTCLAVALGIYSVAIRTPTERVIVREHVIERQVTAATKASAAPQVSGASLSVTDTSTSTTTPPAGGGTDVGAGPEATTPTGDTTPPGAGNNPSPPLVPDGADGPTPSVDPGITDTSAAPPG